MNPRSPMPGSLEAALRRVAGAPILLVASDYDGTLSPIVDDPEAAIPLREAVVALERLAELPDTEVAVISGRALHDLARLSRLGSTIHLVGSHGSEFDAGFSRSLAPEALATRDVVETELRSIAAEIPGLGVEIKPASVALHYRQATEADAERAVAAVDRGAARLAGVQVKHGKKVVEISVVHTDKGEALEIVRRRSGATSVLFLGDDVTDEDAFARLSSRDLAVKVGPGASIAEHRVHDPVAVAQLLAQLYELRCGWLEGGAEPIERHSMLSDLRTVALVTQRGCVDWLCLPRADSPSLFADLIGGPSAGHFTIRPAGCSRSNDALPEVRYRGASLVLETRWPTFTVTDFLDASQGRPGQRAGRSELIRRVEGSGRVLLELAPRIDFGRVQSRIAVRDGGLELLDSPDPLVLRSPGVEWTLEVEGDHHTARAEVELGDSPLELVLCYGIASLRGPNHLDRREAATFSYWQTWAQGLHLPELARDLVLRSALLLKGLAHGPTGALLAAATTSLPESLGGIRNWDYRFCWLRDAALTARALAELGSEEEGMRFLDWVFALVEAREAPERLRPLYAVSGEDLGAEAEIRELPGYRGSRPVRVGNAAAHQLQLDVYGPIVDLVAYLAELGAPIRSEHWRLVAGMIQAVERRWREPDHGIWEIRLPKRQHVHSKVMCWQAVDRALVLEERFRDRREARWEILRDEIAADVLAHGYNEEAGAFTAAYDGTDLDAAVLWVGLSGLLPPDDPLFASTVDAIAAELRDGPTVYRYRSDDGLPGREGGFHVCAFWLVDAYLLLGRHGEAVELFESVCALAGPTGVLSEQYDPVAGIALGNVPQAYSHLGLIGSALRIEAAQKEHALRGGRVDLATP
ncbi:MAG TPA: trehalose-phosphatase [Thermoanaerobaculia bacterium]|nr:trehalose-phosphatase [Thermoanaerobaculia bacterium]